LLLRTSWALFHISFLWSAVVLARQFQRHSSSSRNLSANKHWVLSYTFNIQYSYLSRPVAKLSSSSLMAQAQKVFQLFETIWRNGSLFIHGSDPFLQIVSNGWKVFGTWAIKVDSFATGRLIYTIV
jgi:hypothetical protein